MLTTVNNFQGYSFQPTPRASSDIYIT